MRSPVIDTIKAISIIMIVNVHLLSGQFFLIGETYHVIAFFFTAGIVLGINRKWERISTKDYLKDRSKKLLYPYFCLSLCYILSRIILDLLRRRTIFDETLIDTIIKIFTLRGIGTLWFLPVLFFSEGIFFFLRKRQFNDLFIIIGGIIGVVISYFLNKSGICGTSWYGNQSLYGVLVNNPLSILCACVVSVFFIEIGFITYRYLSSYFSPQVSIKRREILIIALICSISFAIDYLFLKGYRGDLHKLDIGNPLIYILCSISGLSFVFCLSLLLNLLVKGIRKILSFWGENSLVIMTTHAEYFINASVFYLVTFTFEYLSINLTAKLTSLISLVIIMLIESGIIYIVNHTKLRYIYHFPDLVGVRRKMYK